jgi:hypothetical protein
MREAKVWMVSDQRFHAFQSDVVLVRLDGLEHRGQPILRRGSRRRTRSPRGRDEQGEAQCP